jgi:putative ABC transport system permease protein
VILWAENHFTCLTGADARYLEARDIAVARGRGFRESELRTGAAACLMGETVRRELFRGGDPMGRSIRLKTTSCRVIRVMEQQGV